MSFCSQNGLGPIMLRNVEQNGLFQHGLQDALPEPPPHVYSNFSSRSGFGFFDMFQKTRFHLRGVAKIDNLHFCSGFIVKKIRALAQRGAQNSCPVLIWKVFSRCFLLACFLGGEFGTPRPCQSTFAYKMRRICHGACKNAYKTRLN